MPLEKRRGRDEDVSESLQEEDDSYSMRMPRRAMDILTRIPEK